MGGAHVFFFSLSPSLAIFHSTTIPPIRPPFFLSFQARYYSDPALLLRVPASAFMPAPRVNSALVSFDLRAPADRGGDGPGARPAADEKVLGSTIAAAFTQRRKKLRNALAPLFGGDPDAAAVALAGAGVDPDGRADAAEVGDFVRAANAATAAREARQQASEAGAAAGV